MRIRSLAAPALFLAGLVLSGPAGAQVRSVEVRTPRPFGYFLGDLVHADIDLVVEPGFRLQAASLPKPGALTYWLDLRDLDATSAVDGDAQRVRLALTYQTFYAALDARALEIPGFTVTFVSESDHGATTLKAEVPAWSFNVSPLREVQPPARDDPRAYMRPDGQVGPGDPRPLLLGAAGSAALALAASVALARDRAWWPFRVRAGRPFGRAARRIRALSRRPDPTPHHRDALLALHHALDAAAGRRLLADDLGDFLQAHPAYAAEGSSLARFFEASRRTFFGSGPEAGFATLGVADLAALARRLARAERAA
ncbi:nonribosomal peptide synthetase MxaA [Methylobacterium sp. J-078]|uniref:nonribosomal peptide synthetase MxaA n=1 Tax=Methylobacterium sp. J-078 TaxID=2836657 RepID=UPI001FB959C2|nr:nonribosomal peptide synthetase MxaA [Methylobacterium sp. J-078]MCJ2047669.1 nonribosomal peptide synthetase MxaA [Methylobacterium sp. J-078]